MKKLFVAGLAMLTSFGVVGTAVAITYEQGTLVPALEITTFSPGGVDMAGMQVTAYFADGTSSEKLAWSALGSGGGVMGDGWSLFQTGDTFDYDWTLESTGALIEKIVLDGLPGDTVFDISDYNDFFIEDATKDPNAIGTIGSAQGKTFVVTGGSYTYDVSATYNSLVYRTMFNENNKTWVNYNPIGDLYRYLTIDFKDNIFVGSGTSHQTLTFRADTDKMIAPVPEPATLLLVATGLAGLAAVGRRRRG